MSRCPSILAVSRSHTSPLSAAGKDLSGVKVQLDSPVVTRMSEVLHCAKSSYLSRFSRLAHEIQDGSEQAER